METPEERGNLADAPAQNLETWVIAGGSTGAAMYTFHQPGVYMYLNHNLIESKTYAVITAEPSSYARHYTKVYYMYSFSYNGNEYKGNSLINSSTGKPGDSIEVVFLEAYPSINRPTSFFK